MSDRVLSAKSVAQKVGLALACMLAPSAALADGGAPMLLLAGPVVFLVGQVGIVLIEAILLHGLARRLAWRDAFGDAFSANVSSFMWVGVLLPVCVSGLGWLFGLIGGASLYSAGLESTSATFSTWTFALTGWVFNSPVVQQIHPWQFVVWFLLSYPMTVFVETRTLRRRWELRGLVLTLSPARVSWIINAASYLGMAVVLGVMVFGR